MKAQIKSELLADLFPLTFGAEMPPQEKAKLEAQRIMRSVERNPDLLDAIQERASIRWSEGYSDSLYMAVLSGLIDTGEQREFADTPDMKQVEFLRRMGTPETDIMNKEQCPSVWIKLKPRTDWEAELKEYM